MELKYTKHSTAIYAIAFVKLVMTVLVFNGIFALQPLSIVSIFFWCAAAYDPEIVLVSVIVLLVTVIVWICAIILSLLGILLKKVRKASLIVITVAMFIDLVSSFPIASIWSKVLCIIVSSVILGICVKSLFDLHKIEKHI